MPPAPGLRGRPGPRPQPAASGPAPLRRPEARPCCAAARTAGAGGRRAAAGSSASAQTPPPPPLGSSQWNLRAARGEPGGLGPGARGVRAGRPRHGAAPPGPPPPLAPPPAPRPRPACTELARPRADLVTSRPWPRPAPPPWPAPGLALFPRRNGPAPPSGPAPRELNPPPAPGRPVASSTTPSALPLCPQTRLRLGDPRHPAAPRPAGLQTSLDPPPRRSCSSAPQPDLTWFGSWTPKPRPGHAPKPWLRPPPPMTPPPAM